MNSTPDVCKLNLAILLVDYAWTGCENSFLAFHFRTFGIVHTALNPGMAVNAAPGNYPEGVSLNSTAAIRTAADGSGIRIGPP